MTAKQMVLDHAPEWTEEQARRALLAAEGQRSGDRESGLSEHQALMERAAALRARQSKQTDVVALVREVRDELEQRTS
jgi:hypothetical protein